MLMVHNMQENTLIEHTKFNLTAIRTLLTFKYAENLA